MPYDDTYVLYGVYKEGLNKVTAGTDWTQGDNVTVYVANPEAAKGNVKDGTAAAPVTAARPTFKVSKTSAVAGGITGDGSTELPAIYGSAFGLAGSKVQEVGVAGTAKSQGTEGEPDAAGGYFVGRILATGKGRGFGIFAIGRRDNGEARATGAEIAVENQGGSDSYDITNGAEFTKGIWLHGGGSKSAVGVQVGAIQPANTEASFDVGIGINQKSIVTASFQDNSESLKSIEIKGTHATAALEIAAGAGLLSVTNNFIQFAERATPAAPAADGARLYIKDNGSGKSQLAVIFNTGAEIILATQA